MFVVRSQLGLGETCQHCDHIFASAVPAVLLPFSPVVYPLKCPVFTGCLEDVMYSKIGSHVLQTRVLMLRIASSHLSPDHLVRSNPGSWVRRVLRRAQPTCLHHIEAQHPLALVAPWPLSTRSRVVSGQRCRTCFIV